MTLHLPTLLAEQALAERGGSCGPDEIHRLTLLATGDEQRANRARAQRYIAQRQAQFLSGQTGA